MTFIEWSVVACWLLFMLFWAATAFSVKRTERRQGMGMFFLYALPLFIGSALVFKGFSHTAYPWGLGTVITPPSAPFVWLGLFITIAGLVLAIWARLALGRNWSRDVAVKEGHELITNGPYAYVRHPIYTALLLMFLGSALVLSTAAAYLGLVLVFVSCWIKLRMEEKIMNERFPDAYPAYASRVRRLVPFVI